MAHLLVTGATGYIGGRLVPELLAAGHRVRCLARTPSKLDDAAWRADVEVVPGDVTDRASLDAALAGIDAAYFLVHSMGGPADFDEEDRRAAACFRDAAAAATDDLLARYADLTEQMERRDGWTVYVFGSPMRGLTGVEDATRALTELVDR